jgi:hypothetical protein
LFEADGDALGRLDHPLTSAPILAKHSDRD